MGSKFISVQDNFYEEAMMSLSIALTLVVGAVAVLIMLLPFIFTEKLLDFEVKPHRIDQDKAGEPDIGIDHIYPPVHHEARRKRSNIG